MTDYNDGLSGLVQRSFLERHSGKLAAAFIAGAISAAAFSMSPNEPSKNAPENIDKTTIASFDRG